MDTTFCSTVRIEPKVCELFNIYESGHPRVCRIIHRKRIHYGEIGIFRQWLREVYFPEKFPVYQRYRAKRIGALTEQISTRDVRTQIQLARGGMTQLSLFSEAIA